jgi:hypothetical protein
MIPKLCRLLAIVPVLLTNFIPAVLSPTGESWSATTYLKASNTGANDYFGISTAVFGDLAAVGAYAEANSATGINPVGDNNAAAEAGAVYTYIRSNGVWAPDATIKASNTGAGDRFGWSVALSGDTLVVGADREDSNADTVNGNQADNSAETAGAAYVFRRTGGVWTQEAYLKASNSDAGDRFGWSVAISGDTIVVGAYGEASSATGVDGNQASNGSSNAGAAYVFVRSGITWSQQAYLKASNTNADDSFGYTVGIDGDTIVVGAQNEDSSAKGVNGDEASNGSPNAGAAYVFVRSGTTWSQQAYLKASNTETNDFFGTAAAISGDTIVVGAYGEDSNSTGVGGNQANNFSALSGAAYVFTRSETVWSQQA